jgi:hypothetical protein
MLVMRFTNPMFSAWWHRSHVDNVQITFKEDFGTQGRGGYFDQYGIIRDVIQNHLLQVRALHWGAALGRCTGALHWGVAAVLACRRGCPSDGCFQ